MKAIMLMFDSLNRHLLPPYGCDWTHAPNFRRLAERTARFNASYVASMPCMPARRELHTGRYNFLHRSWGPLEPFDDSMPEILKSNGIYSHLCSDHYHYWEEGGCTYHTRYSSWEISRGQEGDSWMPEVDVKTAPVGWNGDRWKNSMGRQDFVNRKYLTRVEDQPQAVTFGQGLRFLEKNHQQDNWFLHIETFDPHEPFFSQQRFKGLYQHDYDGPVFDWPPYRKVTEPCEQVEHMRYEYAALLSMCDEYLGKLLDFMDEHDLWRDTMLIVNTDHGFLLGEHDFWAKCHAPFYDEIAHTPLFIWDPRCGVAGETRGSLVQTIDLAPTLLEYFGLDVPADMQGRPLGQTIAADAPVREAGLYGIFGAHVNVTDGRYVYMRAPAGENQPLFEYTLMPTHMRRTFAVNELQDIHLAEPFSFTKGCRTMKIAGRGGKPSAPFATMLFDTQEDPRQERPLNDPVLERRMQDRLVRLLRESDAPAEQFPRLGLAT